MSLGSPPFLQRDNAALTVSTILDSSMEFSFLISLHTYDSVLGAGIFTSLSEYFST